MVKQGMYWKDENGNQWHEGRYSELEAEEMSKSLHNCHGCLNCEFCENSDFCTNCSWCTGCLDCTHCQNCTSCHWSENLVNCSQCESCANILGGYNQKLVCISQQDYYDALAAEMDVQDYDDYDDDYDDSCGGTDELAPEEEADGDDTEVN